MKQKKYLQIAMPIYRQEINHLRREVWGEDAVISQGDEKWDISLNCKDTELCQIQVKMPNGKTWTGTIQCFMSIFQIAQNAMGVIGHGATVSDEEQNVNIELQNLLDHVK